MAIGDPYTRIGFDPGANNAVVGFYETRALETARKDVSFHDLKSRELLGVVQNEALKGLIEERDTAKALYEEEQDETSFGEYMGLKKAVELLEKFIKEAPSKIYNVEPRNNLKDLAAMYMPANPAVIPKWANGGSV